MMMHGSDSHQGTNGHTILTDRSIAQDDQLNPRVDGFFRFYALVKRCAGRRPSRYEGFREARDFVEIESLLT